MTRVAWLTDIHLEFLAPKERLAFVDGLTESTPDIVLVGGDTGTASNCAQFLQLIEMRLQRPIYFVLGNHDYYHGSIAQVRAAAEELARSAPWLRWLQALEVVQVTKTTGLIGHGSWADGRLGNGRASQVEVNDYYLIKELTGLSQQRRFVQLAKLGDQGAEHFRRFLPRACMRFRNIMLLTHVPPFRDACWHEGQLSDDEYLPHFACKAVGDVLLSVMREYSECKLTVLCGHTHSEGVVNILPNLQVKTGSTEYGRPCLQELFVVE